MKMSVNSAAGPPSLVTTTLANPAGAGTAPNSTGSSQPTSPNQSQPLPLNGPGLWDIPSSPAIPTPNSSGTDPPMSLSSLSRLNSMECWDYTIELECLRGPEDLQLAAELGKTLLERNKELESALKHHQNIIEDQAQEIEYLTKQNGALREVNDSRMKIYEQLEVSIQDLERDKYKLALENQAEKKHVKTLCRNIETLEAKVEELTKTVEDVRRQLDAERKKNERLQSDSLSGSGTGARVQLRPVGGCGGGDGDDASLSGPDEDEITEIETSKPENFSFAFRDQSHSTDVTDGSHLGHSSFSQQGGHHHHNQLSELNLQEENEELIRIMQELERTRKCFVAEQNRVAELEEQLAAIAQENQILQSKIVQINTTEEMKSVHEELSILEEVRQGQMCTRCLRGFEDRPDDESIITGTDADDDRSLMDLIQNAAASDAGVPGGVYRSSVTIKTSSPKPDTLDISGTSSNNPYRELVAKYEALLEVQRNSLMTRKASTATATTLTGGGGSGKEKQESVGQQQQQPQVQTVGEELGSGDFSSLNTKFTDEDGNSKKDDQSSNGGGARRKIGLRTPTDFSEAETTSSGFSDEISNKATQTDERPRNFLCTIADGEDCKFSIYEDQTVIDSRFRFSPSHRELFREIFGILKKAADNRDEGDQLPLLDDQNPVGGATAGGKAAPKVPPVTPANEEPPSEFGDDTQSVISSAVSEQSFAMSECITKSERKKIEKQNKYAEKHTGEQENKPPVGVAALPDGRILTPYKRQPLDYLTVSVGVNKKKSRRRRNRGSGGADADRSDSPVSNTPSSPRTCGNKKGRTLYRPWNPNAPQVTSPNVSNPVSTSSPNGTATAEWNGTSMTIYNRSMNSPTPSANHQPRTPVSGQSGVAAAAASSSFCSPTSAGAAVRPANHNRFADLADEAGDSIVQFKPSTASHDLHKLKKLDLSYAEVLRRADHCKQQAQRRHHHHK